MPLRSVELLENGNGGYTLRVDGQEIRARGYRIQHEGHKPPVVVLDLGHVSLNLKVDAKVAITGLTLAEMQLVADELVKRKRVISKLVDLSTDQRGA